jgi:hypothetical protein
MINDLRMNIHGYCTTARQFIVYTLMGLMKQSSSSSTKLSSREARFLSSVAVALIISQSIKDLYLDFLCSDSLNYIIVLRRISGCKRDIVVLYSEEFC